MARRFVSSSNMVLSGGVAVAAPPFTMALWIQPQNLGSSQAVFALGASASNLQYWRLSIQASLAGVQFSCNDGGGGVSATLTQTLTAGAWSHLVGVAASSALRYVYLNGTKSTANTTPKVPAGINLTSLGAHLGATINNPSNSDCAFGCLWRNVLTDEEIALLALGMHPLLIRPEEIVSFWPLWGTTPEPDWVGSMDLLPTNGPDVVDDPPLWGYGEGRVPGWMAAGDLALASSDSGTVLEAVMIAAAPGSLDSGASTEASEWNTGVTMGTLLTSAQRAAIQATLAATRITNAQILRNGTLVAVLPCRVNNAKHFALSANSTLRARFNWVLRFAAEAEVSKGDVVQIGTAQFEVKDVNSGYPEGLSLIALAEQIAY